MEDKKIAQCMETSPRTGTRFARNLDWNLLRTFHEIVCAGGISEAARALNRGQPAISMSLHRLEKHLDTCLCRRGPSGFSLTADGQLLAQKCQDIYKLTSGIPNAIEDAALEIRGRLRMQLISNLVDDKIDAAIKSFNSMYPNVEVFVSIATADIIQRNIIGNEIEIGIAPVSFRTAGLQYEELFTEIYRPYCGKTHPLFGKTLQSPEELAKYKFVLTGADEPNSQTRFRQRYGLGTHIAGLSEHLEEARRLTILGVGLCFLPAAFAEDSVIAGRLHPVLISDSNPISTIFIISNPNAPAHSGRDQMLDFLTGERS